MTAFDALLLAIIGVSVFFAAVRGGVREVATLAALVLAGLAAWIGAKPVAVLIGKDAFFVIAAAAALIGAGVFAGAYVVLHKAMARWKPSRALKRIDRIGGGVFGLVRALALIGLGFLGYGYYLEDANQPDAVRKALLLPVAVASAEFFEQFAPPNRDLRAPSPAKGANAAVEGYEGRDRSGLREIVTTATTTDDESAARSDDPIADILTEEPAGDDEPE